MDHLREFYFKILKQFINMYVTRTAEKNMHSCKMRDELFITY